MRSEIVVIVSPEGQLPAGIGQAVEDFLVQAFVAQTAIEGLDVTAPLRLSWADILRIADARDCFAPRDRIEVEAFLADPMGWSSAHGGAGTFPV